MRVYLDNCCYNRPYDDSSQKRIYWEAEAKLHIQDMIRQGELELAASYMLIFENQQNPYENRREAIYQFLLDNVSRFISSENEENIRCLLADIMKTGVKKKDAVHIVCAILADCKYFITTDDRLLKYQTDKLELINPIDFVRRLEVDLDDQ